MPNLEYYIQELYDYTNDYMANCPRESFAPVMYPRTKEDVQDWLVRWHRNRGKELPKNFWKKDKRQLNGMYFGINFYENKKRRRYETFLSGYYSIMGCLHPDETREERLVRIGNMKYDDIKKEYNSAMVFYRHIKAL
ncbi:MAG: hypothetical protein NTV63_01490 [Candidatus Woesearchaeota archaeon]|nr:hypothetical protein [Candidatus Woesearchaeota archaeon]